MIDQQGGEHETMDLLYRGAEADVFKGKWCGLPSVFKLRNPLPYRLPELDRLIRSQRTLHEAQMIHLSKEAGVAAPYLYHLSPSDSLLVMEYIEGKRLKVLLQEDEVRESQAAEIAQEFGRSIGRLHSAGIMHGDLTTSNVVIEESGRVRLIDFGLSIHTRRLEDQAVDLRLIKETLVGAHNDISRRFMQSLLSGYSSVLGTGRAEEATKKLTEIERRGRYARVE
jgi:TP53 regulating kinase-like protein